MTDQDSRQTQKAELKEHDSSLEMSNKSAGTLAQEDEKLAPNVPTGQGPSFSDGVAAEPAESSSSASQAATLPRRSGYRDERVREGNRLLDRRAVPRGTTTDAGEWERRRHSADGSEIMPAAQQPAWLNLAEDLLQPRQPSERHNSDHVNIRPSDPGAADEI